MTGHRTLKRVPLDFSWPLGEVWTGYLKPPKKRGRWQPTEPPTGEGYQLWETVSEGSPISPVFASTEALAAWCEEQATLFARFKLSQAAWQELFATAGNLENASLMIVTPTGEVFPTLSGSQPKPAKS